MRSFLAGIALAVAAPLQAQLAPPRSAAYLFSSNVDDARAAWINPAGLGILPIASIYAQVDVDRTVPATDWGVRQYSFGLHSRSIAFSYQRDRLATGQSEGTWRAAAAFSLGRRTAFGTGVTFTSPERGVDVGLRVSPAPALDVGLVVRDIGRPVVRGTKRPLSGILGAATRFAGGRVGLLADAIANEGPISGWDVRYRAGAQLIFPARAPFTLMTAFDLGSTLRVAQWSLGIGVGFAAQALMVGSALPGTGSSTRLESLSLAGIARGLIRSR